MGLFGVRRTASKDHTPSEGTISPSKPNAAVLAKLFADDDDNPDDDNGMNIIPTIEQQENINKSNNIMKPQSRSPGMPSTGHSHKHQRQSHGQRNKKVENKETLSRLVRRDSIKRSISRKIARSESRRQLLNIKDERSNAKSNTAQASQKNSSLNASSPHAVSHTADAHQHGHRQKGVTGLENKMSALTMSPVTPAIATGRDEDSGMDLPPASLKEMNDKNKSNFFPPASESSSSMALSLEAATFAMPEKQHHSRGGTAAVPPSTGSKQRSRRRPPPLGTEGKVPDSATEWASGRVFGSDGGFITGGFRITAEGMLARPELETRQDSDTEADTEAPQSEAIVNVRGLKEFRNGPTIGAGAAGRVYLADHIPSKTTMAIKVVNVYNKEKRNQLLKELETLCTHVSRYLVRFHGAFYDGSGAVHIALEYMDHGCLATFVQRVGAIPERIVQMIAQDCLRGLRFLHRHHVLHRDFKTANILLSRKLCRAKLSDFGLARDLHPGVSKVDTFVGTVAYMSPERLQGGKYTYASDIWALGISVVECLIGHHPFNKPQNYFDYIEATAASGSLQGFDTKDERFSEDARDFITQCTHNDPKQRPQATDLWNTLGLKECAETRRNLEVGLTKHDLFR